MGGVGAKVTGGFQQLVSCWENPHLGTETVNLTPAPWKMAAMGKPQRRTGQSQQKPSKIDLACLDELTQTSSISGQWMLLKQARELQGNKLSYIMYNDTERQWILYKIQ